MDIDEGKYTSKWNGEEVGGGICDSKQKLWICLCEKKKKKNGHATDCFAVTKTQAIAKK